MALVISSVAPDSLAQELGLEPGDRIIRVDEQLIDDYIDFGFYTAEPEFELEIEKSDGRIRKFVVQRHYGQSMGLNFQSPVERTHLCRNHCLFCFLDQSPPGQRQSLRVKDDDYRLSFLHGNFVTLTNVSDTDWERILTLRLSPLYISVHATNPEVRRRMMQNPRAGQILNQLRDLTEAGIDVHGQIVLCPGINDGQVLKETLDDLQQLGPHIRSVAVVPVGLTGYRQNLNPLSAVDPDLATQTIAEIETRQKHMLASRGTRWVWPADELYLLSGLPIPPYDSYEDFPQLENGVGIAARFLHEFSRTAATLPSSIPKEKRVSVATAKLGGQVLEGPVARLNAVGGLTVELWIVPNAYYGGRVSVAGLLTGSDLINFLSERELGERLLIPEVCVRDKRLFLDDLTIDDVSAALNVPVVPVSGAAELVERMIEDA